MYSDLGTIDLLRSLWGSGLAYGVRGLNPILQGISGLMPGLAPRFITLYTVNVNHSHPN